LLLLCVALRIVFHRKVKLIMKIIEVHAGRNQEEVLNRQCEVVQQFDTIAEAKKKAKYYLSAEYQKYCEASEPLRYSQVVVNGDCVADYFSK
jgi:hypothetical protein